MLKVIKEDNGVWVVNENDLAVWVSSKRLNNCTDLVVTKQLPKQGEVVYRYDDPLEIGAQYTETRIDQSKKETMVVIGVYSQYAYQYLPERGGWTSARVDSPLEELPAGKYIVLTRGAE